jgi:hypothetical protein
MSEILIDGRREGSSAEQAELRTLKATVVEAARASRDEAYNAYSNMRELRNKLVRPVVKAKVALGEALRLEFSRRRLKGFDDTLDQAIERLLEQQAALAQTKVEYSKRSDAYCQALERVARLKAPGGQFNYEQVRNIVRQVAMNPKLGSWTALNVLDREGHSAKNVSDLEPEHLDRVYERCERLLAGVSTSIKTDQNPHVDSMIEEDDEDDKVIGRIYAPPGYGLEYVEMMKDNYRRWAAAGDPMYIEIVKQMDGDDTEHQDDPSAHHGHARR